MPIKQIANPPRGCGKRKKGGLYLVTEGKGHPCSNLPVPLGVVGELTFPDFPSGKPGRLVHQVVYNRYADGERIKFSRSPRMLYSTGLLRKSQPICKNTPCYTCPNSPYVDQRTALLIWVGKQHYNSPQKFLSEAAVLGISRRIPQLPGDFVLGETWVWLAHVNAIPLGNGVLYEKYWDIDGNPVTHLPGVFAMFLPKEIQYVITGKETDDELHALERKGITLVTID